jgi:hypothetical protein
MESQSEIIQTGSRDVLAAPERLILHRFPKTAKVIPDGGPSGYAQNEVVAFRKKDHDEKGNKGWCSITKIEVWKEKRGYSVTKPPKTCFKSPSETKTTRLTAEEAKIYLI